MGDCKYKTKTYYKSKAERISTCGNGFVFIGVGALVVMAGIECIVSSIKGFSEGEADEVEEI